MYNFSALLPYIHQSLPLTVRMLPTIGKLSSKFPYSGPNSPSLRSAATKTRPPIVPQNHIQKAFNSIWKRRKQTEQEEDGSTIGSPLPPIAGDSETDVVEDVIMNANDGMLCMRDRGVLM